MIYREKRERDLDPLRIYCMPKAPVQKFNMFHSVALASKNISLIFCKKFPRVLDWVMESKAPPHISRVQPRLLTSTSINWDCTEHILIQPIISYKHTHEMIKMLTIGGAFRRGRTHLAYLDHTTTDCSTDANVTMQRELWPKASYSPLNFQYLTILITNPLANYFSSSLTLINIMFLIKNICLLYSMLILSQWKSSEYTHTTLLTTFLKLLLFLYLQIFESHYFLLQIQLV